MVNRMQSEAQNSQPPITAPPPANDGDDPKVSTNAPEQPPEQPEEQLLEWSIQDTTPERRSPKWYIILGLLSATTIIIAIITESWVIIPLGILIPWALSLYANRGIGNHTYELSTLRVTVDGKSYPYNNYKSFFVVTNSKRTTFELVPTKRFGQLTTLHASATNAEDITEILSSVLPETESQGYIGESIFQKLKFWALRNDSNQVK